MKLRSLLVPEKRVRDPDVLLRVHSEADLGQFRVRRVVAKSRVSPRLPEVDVHLVILHSNKNKNSTAIKYKKIKIIVISVSTARGETDSGRFVKRNNGNADETSGNCCPSAGGGGACAVRGITPKKIFETVYVKSCNPVHLWRS